MISCIKFCIFEKYNYKEKKEKRERKNEKKNVPLSSICLADDYCLICFYIMDFEVIF